MDLVEPIMGVRHWDDAVDVPTETVTVGFREGWPVSLDGVEPASPLELVLAANAIGWPARLGHERPDREPDHRGQEPRHLRGPWHGLLHIAYERLVSAIHNEGTIENYRTMGRRLGRLLYEGRWFDPQALMLREPLLRWVGVGRLG